MTVYQSNQHTGDSDAWFCSGYCAHGEIQPIEPVLSVTQMAPTPLQAIDSVISTATHREVEVPVLKLASEPIVEEPDD